MTAIRKVAWLHVAERRLLCVRTAGRGLFYVPGGKPEAGEDDATALVREIREELGVALDPATIAPRGRFVAAADGAPGREVIVDAYAARPDGRAAPQGEIAELRFVGTADATHVSAATAAILRTLQAEHVVD